MSSNRHFCFLINSFDTKTLLNSGALLEKKLYFLSFALSVNITKSSTIKLLKWYIAFYPRRIVGNSCFQRFTTKSGFFLWMVNPKMVSDFFNERKYLTTDGFISPHQSMHPSAFIIVWISDIDFIVITQIVKINIVVFWPSTWPKMPFKVMHRKEVTHSNGSYERKSRGRKLADEMGRGKKIPMVHS